MATLIKLRRDTSANWTNANPILHSGEPGLETDTTKIKYGDGTTHWISLPYATGSGSGGSGGTQGTQGIQGIQGIQGTDGVQGIQGLQGIGIQGISGAVSGNYTFTDNVLTVNTPEDLTIIGNSDPFITGYYGRVTINEGRNDSGFKIYPNAGPSASVDNIGIEVNTRGFGDDLKSWYFKNNGVFQLPENGTIVDSTGTPLLNVFPIDNAGYLQNDGSGILAWTEINILPEDASGVLQNDGAGTLTWVPLPTPLPDNAIGFLQNNGDGYLSWDFPLNPLPENSVGFLQNNGDGLLSWNTTIDASRAVVNGDYSLSLTSSGTLLFPGNIYGTGTLTLNGYNDQTSKQVLITGGQNTDDSTWGDVIAITVSSLTGLNNITSYNHDQTVYAPLGLTGSVVSIHNETKNWSFNSNGTTSFPNYTFPAENGSSDQVLKLDSYGVVNWKNAINILSNYVFLTATELLELGAAELTEVFGPGTGDDQITAITLPFPVSFAGNSYYDIFVSSNSFVSFGTTANYIPPYNPGNPELATIEFLHPCIMVTGGDNSYQQLFAGEENNGDTYRIRYEGTNTSSGTPGSPNIVWEMTFHKNTPELISLNVIIDPLGGNGTTLISDSQRQLSTFTIADGSSYDIRVVDRVNVNSITFADSNIFLAVTGDQAALGILPFNDPGYLVNDGDGNKTWSYSPPLLAYEASVTEVALDLTKQLHKLDPTSTYSLADGVTDGQIIYLIPSITSTLTTVQVTIANYVASNTPLIAGGTDGIWLPFANDSLVQTLIFNQGYGWMLPHNNFSV